MSSTSSRWTPEAEEYENSTAKVWGGRAFSFIILIITFMTLVFSVVKGTSNAYYYLLSINIITSGIMVSMIAYWYHKDQLAADKYWFTIMVGIIFLLQNIGTNTYIFQ